MKCLVIGDQNAVPRVKTQRKETDCQFVNFHLVTLFLVSLSQCNDIPFITIMMMITSVHATLALLELTATAPASHVQNIRFLVIIIMNTPKKQVKYNEETFSIRPTYYDVIKWFCVVYFILTRISSCLRTHTFLQ